MSSEHTNKHDKVLTHAEFAALGTGHVAYMRRMAAEDFSRRFGVNGELPTQGQFWALFGANGLPILLADAQEAAIMGAMENELTTVSLH